MQEGSGAAGEKRMQPKPTLGNPPPTGSADPSVKITTGAPRKPRTSTLRRP